MRCLLLVFTYLFFPLATLLANDYLEKLPQNEVHIGDYFSVGKFIEISGTVQGDVYVFGGKIFIDGKVEGDVIAFGATIEILGEITGNVRLAGGDVKIYGRVGRNMTIMSANLQCFPFAEILGNAHALANTIDLGGKFSGNVNLMGSGARVGADIVGNLKAYVGELRLTSKASVRGKVIYSSSSVVEIDQGANISGKVEEKTSTFFRPGWKKTFVFSSRLVGLLMNFLFSFVLGLIVIKFFHAKLHRSLVVLKESPWKAFGVGLLMIISVPVGCILLFVTVLGIPFALALITLAILSFYAAKILPIIWISNNLFSKFHLQKNSPFVFFLGLILFFLIRPIALLGTLMSLIFTLLGLGTAVLSRISYKGIRKKTG